MYESHTYEKILSRALENVPDNMDKRQGSIIYDALAPACIEMAQMYIELDNMLNLVFAHTSSGEFLDKRCQEIGIIRKPATKAVRKGTFTGVVPSVGSRFNCGDLIYRVIDISDENNILLECEEVGSIGNENSGDLVPITEIPGLEFAELKDTKAVIPGEEEESDEELLKRFDIRVKKSSTSGNVSHYIEWTGEVGVGAVRALPQWNGKNTIKLLIVDSKMVPASDTLVHEVQEHIDPDSEGLGYGQAPIGACCTVEKPESLVVNISAEVSGVQPKDIEEKFKEKIKEYFHTLITESWQTQSSYKISIAKIGAILLQTVGEESGDDYDNLVINGGTDSITLEDKIPVVGDVKLNEQTE